MSSREDGKVDDLHTVPVPGHSNLVTGTVPDSLIEALLHIPSSNQRSERLLTFGGLC